MNRHTFKLLFLSATTMLILGSCQKKERPGLDPNYPTDDKQVLIPGDLRFFASFNKTDGPSLRWNATDSISSNPALLYPLSYGAGITGNALKGSDGDAALYLNANDFKTATNFSIALSNLARKIEKLLNWVNIIVTILIVGSFVAELSC